MTTLAEYLHLATRYERAAGQAADPAARRQLEAVAETYLTLAKSLAVLERSTEVVEEAKRTQKR
ncbi:hypothetical protein BRAS3843_3040011 [Bradyrhizobium sp. STM 3843]|uniref:hypothetical protein n=1 Tax=Bradyrhizobium sp. STM 3843 TaxID=551947 RepID=UPI0002403FF9|nr:hypothetical protein [Bradyrhizobium sp. STM 3843]CCE09126.1 hypothetical protein BRAS3843_3040011 [Bradyrhizobium sp. STM 3843]